MSVEASAFDEWRESRPYVDRLLVKALASRISDMSEQVVEALFLPVGVRVARRLLLLDEAVAPTEVGAWVRIRQEELASFCGASRPAVNRALSDLARSGLVERGRGRLRVLSRAPLAKYAGIA